MVKDHQARFQRALKRASHLRTGNRIRVKGSRLTGVINSINTKMENVRWDNGVPYFIEIATDDGGMHLAHPTQLHVLKGK